jgi:hypothetical protein
MDKLIKKLLRESILKSQFKGRNILYHSTFIDKVLKIITDNKIEPRTYQPSDFITQIPYEAKSSSDEDAYDLNQLQMDTTIIDTGPSYTAQQSVNMAILDAANK